MQENQMRKIHRQIGIFLVWFLAVQAVTGLLISLGSLLGGENSWFAVSFAIHTGWNPWGSIYRILLALFTAAQGLGGIMIYSMMRRRMKKT